MTTPQFIVRDGRAMMVVKPSQAMMHSGMVKDVLERGRYFVVDLNTGSLTIAGPSGDKADQPMLHYMVADQLINIELPKSWKEARITLDKLTDSFTPSTFESPVTPYFQMGDTTINYSEWPLFCRQVRKVYRARLHA